MKRLIDMIEGDYTIAGYFHLDHVAMDSRYRSPDNFSRLRTGYQKMMSMHYPKNETNATPKLKKQPQNSKGSASVSRNMNKRNTLTNDHPDYSHTISKRIRGECNNSEQSTAPTSAGGASGKPPKRASASREPVPLPFVTVTTTASVAQPESALTSTPYASKRSRGDCNNSEQSTAPTSAGGASGKPPNSASASREPVPSSRSGVGIAFRASSTLTKLTSIADAISGIAPATSETTPYHRPGVSHAGIMIANDVDYYTMEDYNHDVDKHEHAAEIDIFDGMEDGSPADAENDQVMLDDALGNLESEMVALNWVTSSDTEWQIPLRLTIGTLSVALQNCSADKPPMCLETKQYARVTLNFNDLKTKSCWASDCSQVYFNTASNPLSIFTVVGMY